MVLLPFTKLDEEPISGGVIKKEGGKMSSANQIACNPQITCCPDVTLGDEEVSTPVLTTTPPHGDSFVSVTPNNSLAAPVRTDAQSLERATLAYSEQVITNVVATVDAVDSLAQDCTDGIREKTGLIGGFVRDSLALGCIAGGTLAQLPEAILSLPDRLGDSAYYALNGTPEEQGRALAAVPFYAVEFAGYGQMASGLARGAQATQALPPESTPVIGNIIMGGGGEAVSYASPAVACGGAAVLSSAGSVAAVLTITLATSATGGRGTGDSIFTGETYDQAFGRYEKIPLAQLVLELMKMLDAVGGSLERLTDHRAQVRALVSAIRVQRRELRSLLGKHAEHKEILRQSVIGNGLYNDAAIYASDELAKGKPVVTQEIRRGTIVETVLSEVEARGWLFGYFIEVKIELLLRDLTDLTSVNMQ